MFSHLKNANTIHFKKSLYTIVTKKNVQKMTSVHGSSVLTVNLINNLSIHRTAILSCILGIAEMLRKYLIRKNWN